MQLKKPRTDQQERKYCPWIEMLYGPVKAFSSLVGFHDEYMLKV